MYEEANKLFKSYSENILVNKTVLIFSAIKTLYNNNNTSSLPVLATLCQGE